MDENWDVFAGSSLNLTCSATGEPSVQYSWKLNNDIITEVSDDGDLIIDEVTKDQTGDLSCDASNSEGSDVKHSNLVVVDATTVTSDTHEEIVKNAGESLSLSCDVTVDDNIQETVTRKWLKDGVELGILTIICI